MPGLLVKPLQTSFHFLNVESYNATALGCFMVLFLKRPAGLNLLCPTGSLNLAVFCLLFDFSLRGLGWETWGGLLCSVSSVCMDWLKSLITGSRLHGLVG